MLEQDVPDFEGSWGPHQAIPKGPKPLTRYEKLSVAFGASGCAFLQWFWFVLIAM